MSLLLKKWTAMYTTRFALSLSLQKTSWRGEKRHWGFLDIPMESCTDLQLWCLYPRTQQVAGKEGGKRQETDTSVSANTGMNSVSAEPNVRPIKVYWDQVVLVSLKVKADSYNQTWGWIWWWQCWASWVVGFSAPLSTMMMVVVVSESAVLINVLGEPAETLAVALPL